MVRRSEACVRSALVRRGALRGTTTTIPSFSPAGPDRRGPARPDGLRRRRSTAMGYSPLRVAAREGVVPRQSFGIITPAQAHVSRAGRPRVRGAALAVVRRPRALRSSALTRRIAAGPSQRGAPDNIPATSRRRECRRGSDSPSLKKSSNVPPWRQRPAFGEFQALHDYEKRSRRRYVHSAWNAPDAQYGASQQCFARPM